MTQRKTIAVIGATGAQGGGLVRAILADPAGGFAARAITRKASSDKAKALAAQGVEVVEAEIDHIWKDLGVPTTLLLTSFYWDNFIHFGMGPKAGPDGTLAIALPMGDK